MRPSLQRAAAAAALAFLALAPLTTAPAAEREARAKTQKPRQLPQAPASELITRILAEEVRLDTARRLSALAVTQDEKQLAQKALRLADHQLDLAFLIALRRAADRPEPSTPALKDLESSVRALQTNVDGQQDVVDKLTKQAAKARGRRKQTLQEQIEVEQAKLELANDELASAREDLIGAGGDLKSQIERLQADYKAAQQAADTAAAAAPADTSDTLLGHLKIWFGLHNLRNQLEAAQQDAAAAAETLRERLDSLEKESGGAVAAAAAPSSSSVQPETNKAVA